MSGEGDATRLFDLDPAAVRCPYPVYDGVRDETPAKWFDELNAFMVTRYDDVLAVVRNPEVFSSRMPTGPVAMQRLMEIGFELFQDSEEFRDLSASGSEVLGTAVLLMADPPLHDRQRALVSRAFTLPRVRKMEDSIRAVADDLIDRFAGRGSVELVNEFAVLLPLTVIARALGVPTDDMDTFKRWSDAFVSVIGNHHQTQEVMLDLIRNQVEFFHYFRAVIDDRRAEPRDDLITDIVQARVDGEHPLSEGEMLGMLVQFLVAGNETTTKLLASALLLLATRPELTAALRADPSLIPGLVEEVLRVESPVQGLFRQANVDTKIGEVDVPAGSHVWVVYGAANRDGCTFAAPAEVDIHRPNAKSHLAFGQGVHYCIGASLARAEGVIGIERILARLDDIELDIDSAALEYEPSYVLHGLKELPLRFVAKT